jgi:hypothetical protein
MNFQPKTFLFVLLSATLMFAGMACKKDVFKRNIWVKKGETIESVRSSFAAGPGKEITHPAGVYRSGNLLLLLEKGVGIGIMDISVRENPTPIAFIELLANSHAVIKDQIILADNGPDLVSIDISDFQNITLENRLENVFPDKWLEEGKTVFTGYEEQKISIFKKYSASDTIPPDDRSAENMAALAIGRGGSETRFALMGNYLYVARDKGIRPFDVTNAASPVMNNELGYTLDGFETILANNGYLYIGTSNGVVILNANASPATPSQEAIALRTITGCDPVVVQGNFMFSTVRSGASCSRFSSNSSGLFVHDIANKKLPFTIFTETVENPKGLGIDGKLLFLCQGDMGLSIYDWNETTKRPTFRYRYNDIHAFDVIANDKTLIVAAENGLFLYDYSDPNNLKKLSRVAAYY